MARRREDDSDDEERSRGGRRMRADAEGEPPEPDPEEGPDPDRLLRLRFVYGFITVLFGAFAMLLVGAIFSIVASGRVDWPVATAAVLVAVGSALLLARGVLRPLMTRRPENDELRSLTGFVSLIAGFVLLGAVASFILLTMTVLLRGAGEAAFFLLPLVVLAYFTLQLLREATDDFLKRTRLRREFGLFLTSIAYFALTVLTAQLLFAASTVTPIVLASPPDGAVVPAGTALDLTIDDPSVSRVTYTVGSGEVDLPAPYDINTTGWADGDYAVAVTAYAPVGASANLTFRVTIDSTAPAVSFLSPANNSTVPAGTPLRVAVSDEHLSYLGWSEPTRAPPPGFPFGAPREVHTDAWPAGSYDVTVTARDAAGNTGTATLHVTLT